MTKFSKSLALFLVLGVFVYVVLNSCIDQRITSTTAPAIEKTGINQSTNAQVTTAVTFSSEVGRPIDGATGVRWMNNFANSNKSAVSEYIIPVAILKSILGSASCVGVVFYYAIDDSKELHIVPIGVDRTGKVLAWRSITLGNTTIDWQTVWPWINNYSGSIRSHFFGSQILVSTYLQAKDLRISRAINDVGVPQLLLSDAATATPLTYSDESRPCPPYCGN